jgi:repressor LexA
LELEYGVDENRDTTDVPLMGYVGAGAEIEPDFEQVPEDGLDTISVPFHIHEDMAAFMVKGDSMLPRYDDGDVIVVWRAQRRATETFYGEEVAVRTSDGRRFVKQVVRSVDGVTLLSFNAKPIENVTIDWVGEIYATIRSSQFKRIEKKFIK